MNTQPPTHQTYPKCHSVTIHILWMVHGVGGCVVEWWLEGSWGGWWWGGGWKVHGKVVCVVVWVVVGWVVGGFIEWVHILTNP